MLLIKLFILSRHVFIGLKIGAGYVVNFNNVNFIGFKNYAIYLEGGSLSFDKCSFSSSRGGVNSRSSKLSFNNCEFTNNFNNSVLKVNNGGLILNDSTFKNNSFYGSGSVISSVNTVGVSIDGCTFSDNHADIRGGCISLDGDGYNSSVSGSRVSGNTANGGGFLFTTGKNYTIRLTNNNFNNNRAVGHDNNNDSSVNGVGGVILSATNGAYKYFLKDNKFETNVATGGGALLACFREGGTFKFNGNILNINDIFQVEAKKNTFDFDWDGL